MVSLVYIFGYYWWRSELFSRGPQDPTNIKSKILLIVIIFITLISRQVGTVGGGTSLAAQQNNLQLLTSAPDVDINAALLAQVRIPYIPSVRVQDWRTQSLLDYPLPKCKTHDLCQMILHFSAVFQTGLGPFHVSL